MFFVCLFTETGISVSVRQVRNSAELQRILRNLCIRMTNAKKKKDFCKRFMGVDWADMTKYNLCLDNGTLGYEKCVEEIESALEILKK